MVLQITRQWEQLLEDELDQEYFKDLHAFVEEEYENATCYPREDDIFRAFELCVPANLEVVIIGQDPYHGEGQANGLCFSVTEGVTLPPSLVNIYKEIGDDLGKPYPESGDLSSWAGQGVLLLNATLTVRANQAGSHQGKGWERFTDAVIRKISDQYEGIVFMLWGGYARKKSKLIDKHKHHILESGHPSPLSANRGYWFGNRHFSQCNELLKKQGKTPIDW